jgi:hypothetical protein
VASGDFLTRWGTSQRRSPFVTANICRRILLKNMQAGRIDKAPIVSDVRNLTKRDLIKLSPDMITAGFPCQDISIASVGGLGLKGSKSGLFYEILRIVDIQKNIRIVFLENSHNIINLGKNGIDTIMDEFAKRRFRVTYVVQSSKDCGSPHGRLRWFALAVRGAPPQQMVANFIRHNWSSEPCPRVVPHGDNAEFKKSCMERCRRLGNSVVPNAVVRAWNTLLQQRVLDCPAKHLSWPDTGVTFKLVRSRFTKHNFPTPTYNGWHSYRTMTARSTRVIGNVLYNEEQTYHQVFDMFSKGKIKTLPKKYHIDSVVTINPNIVEWMMGFPKNWTRFGQ